MFILFEISGMRVVKICHLQVTRLNCDPKMENILKAAILSGANDEIIENIILHLLIK